MINGSRDLLSIQKLSAPQRTALQQHIGVMESMLVPSVASHVPADVMAKTGQQMLSGARRADRRASQSIRASWTPGLVMLVPTLMKRAKPLRPSHQA